MLIKFLLFCSVRCNPYCEVIVDGQRGNIKTEVLKKTTRPIWDEEFTLWVYKAWSYKNWPVLSSAIGDVTIGRGSGLKFCMLCSWLMWCSYECTYIWVLGLSIILTWLAELQIVLSCLAVTRACSLFIWQARPFILPLCRGNGPAHQNSNFYLLLFKNSTPVPLYNVSSVETTYM